MLKDVYLGKFQSNSKARDISWFKYWSKNKTRNFYDIKEQSITEAKTVDQNNYLSIMKQLFLSITENLHKYKCVSKESKKNSLSNQISNISDPNEFRSNVSNEIPTLPSCPTLLCSIWPHQSLPAAPALSCVAASCLTTLYYTVLHSTTL